MARSKMRQRAISGHGFAMSRSFLRELKRRNVWRAVLLYAGTVWALAQGIAQLAPALGLPDWTTRAFLVASAIGFPLWVAFAWFYELTPKGFKRDSEIAADAPVRRASARKLDIAIIGVLLVAIALLTTGYFIRGKATVATTPTAFNPPRDSIVVLPFANLSDDPTQRYFSDGITEELTAALGRGTRLAVTGWQTASRFAGSKLPPGEIGRTLNVANILDGSIQREGNAVRVSVELVSAVTGKQLWSSHYDDTLQNIFAVQDRISNSIASALKVRFAGTQSAPTLNPQAHNLYLKGLAALNRFTAEDTQAAQGYFQQAVQLDPNYADAWAGLAYGWLQTEVIGSSHGWRDISPKLRAAANKALALDPRNVSALTARGDAEFLDGYPRKAAATLKQALKLNPSNVRAHQELAVVLIGTPESLALLQAATRLDPDNAFVLYVLQNAYQGQGEWQRAVAVALKLNKLSPHNVLAAFALALSYTQMGRGEDAVKAFDLVQPVTPLDQQMVDAGRMAYQAMLQPTLRPAALAALGRVPRDGLHGVKRMKLIEVYRLLGDKQAAQELMPGFCNDIPGICGYVAPDAATAPASSN